MKLNFLLFFVSMSVAFIALNCKQTDFSGGKSGSQKSQSLRNAGADGADGADGEGLPGGEATTGETDGGEDSKTTSGGADSGGQDSGANSSGESDGGGDSSENGGSDSGQDSSDGEGGKVDSEDGSKGGDDSISSEEDEIDADTMEDMSIAVNDKDKDDYKIQIRYKKKGTSYSSWKTSAGGVLADYCHKYKKTTIEIQIKNKHQSWDSAPKNMCKTGSGSSAKICHEDRGGDDPCKCEDVEFTLSCPSEDIEVKGF